MGKSGLTNDENQVNSKTCISDTLCVGDKTSAGNKNGLRDASLQELHTTQDTCDKNSRAPALMENKFLQNVIQDISSDTTQHNVSVSFPSPLSKPCEVAN
jgi:arabidopsis histidine kinase 2/3/4 (cytokinin receptor)